MGAINTLFRHYPEWRGLQAGEMQAVLDERIERGRIRTEGGGSNPSPVPRQLEETPSRPGSAGPACPSS